MSDLSDAFITKLLTEKAEEFTKTQNHYVFDFFGSIERFMEIGHLYIIEELPVEIDWAEIEGFGSDETTIRFTQQFRIRLKTEEELEQTKHIGKPTRESVKQAWETKERLENDDRIRPSRVC